MNEAQVLDIAQDAIWTLLKVSGPILLVGLAIGLTISLFQALTQIQEMTLTFVPKIIVVFLSLMFLMPFMFRQLSEFTLRVMDNMISGGI
jgi:flagellar biosynthetic protein FliQ